MRIVTGHKTSRSSSFAIAASFLIALCGAMGTMSASPGATSWYVVAHLSQSCAPSSLTSASRNFNRAPNDSCTGNAPPVAISPAEGSFAFSPVTFEWTAAPGAIGYRVWVVLNGILQDVGTTTATNLTSRIPRGAVSWYVEAGYTGCAPVASQTVKFTVADNECSLHGHPTLVSPTNGVAVSSPVTLQWTPVPDADGYRVFGSLNNGVRRVVAETNATKVSVNVDAGSVVWSVDALFNGCASTSSERGTFRITASQNCPTTAPLPMNPPAGAQLSSEHAVFSWSGVSNAVGYEVWLSLSNGTPTLIGTTTSTSLAFDLAQPASYFWYVVAKFNGCAPAASQRVPFSFAKSDNCTTQRSHLLAPVDTQLTSPADLVWTNVPGATNYEIMIQQPGAARVVLTSTGTRLRDVVIPDGATAWWVKALFGGGCAPTVSTHALFNVTQAPASCTPPSKPTISAPAQVSSGLSYTIRWNRAARAQSYVLQEATQPNFANATNLAIDGMEGTATHTNTSPGAVAYYYRVLAIGDCQTRSVSSTSRVATVLVLPSNPSDDIDGSQELSSGQMMRFTVPIGSDHAGEHFSATPTRPWITVTPSSGVVPAGGATLNVVADTTDLPIGSSLGGVALAFSSSTATGRIATNATGSKIIPVSISIVSPVTPVPKSGPPPDALIIPAVAHADGFNSKFESDVRVSNTSPQVMRYQLTFTPTGDTGIADGFQTTMDIEPGQTIALDDVLKGWFGTATTSSIGTLEIRPLTPASSETSSAAVKGLSNFVTFASSRTFNVTGNGTFGQYIPAVLFANFVGGATDSAKAPLLSLQQIAQSSSYRTNLGLLEASGNPVSLLVSVFGDQGQKLTSFPVDLTGGQHMQLNGFLSARGIEVNDGRVEVSVTSGDGKVTAYASVLDNLTNDPLLVSPVTLSDSSSSKYVLPGVAQFTGGAKWQTDSRLFNAGTNAVKATLTFHSLDGSGVKTATMDLAPGQLVQLDRTLETVFGITNDGGALHIETDTPSNLIATARTFRPDTATGGTFGQFIQAVTPDSAVTLGSRPLQILQVEQSERYRSNIGIAEVSGKATSVEVTVIPPDSKLSAHIQVDLAANQFTQISSLLQTIGLGDTSNARVTVKVVGGEGSVTAYASVIDALTEDPTFVPAQ